PIKVGPRELLRSDAEEVLICLLPPLSSPTGFGTHNNVGDHEDYGEKKGPAWKTDSSLAAGWCAGFWFRLRHEWNLLSRDVERGSSPRDPSRARPRPGGLVNRRPMPRERRHRRPTSDSVSPRGPDLPDPTCHAGLVRSPRSRLTAV